MTVKEVKFESDAQEKIVSGVTILAKSVKSTLGPHGRTVLLESKSHIGGMTATKDGVTVADSITVMDPFEDIAVRIVREAARKTAFLAGDGPQPLYAKVATPNGFVEIQNLKVGDEICGTNGSVQHVLGTFQKGIREIYEVKIYDGRIVECSKDHLWNVVTQWGFNKTMTTEALINTGKISYKKDGFNNHDYYIPLTEVEFNEKEVSIDPYFLGLLLGDGSLKGSCGSSIELSIGLKKEYVLDKIILPEGVTFTKTWVDRKNYFRIKFQGKLRGLLDNYKLLGTGSGDKFIPKEYLHNSLEVRKSLLQGLLDTDGHINERGLFEYSTISKSLCNNIVELCNGLNIPTTWYLMDRKSGSSYSDTSIYRIGQRKGFKYGEQITSIKPTGRTTEMMCIKVSNQDSLYITDNYVVTHNTTTAIVLAEAILKETLKRTSPSDNMTDITRNISFLIDRVISSLDNKSKDVTGEMLYHVATISSNNDAELGKMIGEAYEEIGKEGVVHVKNHKGYETTCEVSDGITFDRGYSSVLQITNHKGKSCELINPYILVTDRKIESLHNIGVLFQAIVESGRPVLIIGELGKDAQDTFGYNIVNNVFVGANVIPPGRGHLQEELLMDIAAATGATFISDKTGTEWGLVTLDNLGTADKVIVDRESTNIVKQTNPEAMEERLESLREQLKNAKEDHETKILQDRIANLCGKVATINVGGSTPMEQKERKDRVDDAVLATKAALEEGVLAGGGIALLEESNIISVHAGPNMILAADILSVALTAPFRQILLNGHIDPEEIQRELIIGDGMGYNSKTGKYGDMFKLGVIDPAKVTKTALKNGGAVAITLLMSDTVITTKREKPAENVDLEKEVVEWSLLWGLLKFKSKG